MKALLCIVGTCAGLFLMLLAYGMPLPLLSDRIAQRPSEARAPLPPSLNQRVAKAEADGLRSVELYESDERRVRNAVASVLKDPMSAQYGKSAGYINALGETLVCGTVNARNGFGGYTGNATFYGVFVDDNTFTLNTIDDANSNTALRTCLDSALESAKATLAYMEKHQTNSKAAPASSEREWGSVVVKN